MFSIKNYHQQLASQRYSNIAYPNHLVYLGHNGTFSLNVLYSITMLAWPQTIVMTGNITVGGTGSGGIVTYSNPMPNWTTTKT